MPKKIKQVKPLAAQFDVTQVPPLVELDELVRQAGLERPADPAILDGWQTCPECGSMRRLTT